MFKDKVLLITGGTGSFGNAVLRRFLKTDIGEIRIFSRDEKKQDDMRKIYNNPKLKFYIGDVRDYNSVMDVMRGVDFVFHAAAHKHVPLMERNPEEAVKNNIYGTKNLIESSVLNEVEKFVLISTDKAVNPTSVMGATKRVTEMLVEHYNKKGKTKFMAVRFGNVLGSNGSVIPIFKKKIAERKNLTVTHPDIIRYFMTISEASQLVLRAGSLGNGGEVFVLDMGEPVKIIELAKKMIELSGLEKEIGIEITGLRPGEKLYEELLYDIKHCEKTESEKIYIAKLKSENDNLEGLLEKLKESLDEYNNEKIKNI